MPPYKILVNLCRCFQCFVLNLLSKFLTNLYMYRYLDAIDLFSITFHYTDHSITVSLIPMVALSLRCGCGWNIPTTGKECSSIREKMSECGHMRYT
jgi:hypothetical protein